MYHRIIDESQLSMICVAKDIFSHTLSFSNLHTTLRKLNFDHHEKCIPYKMYAYFCSYHQGDSINSEKHVCYLLYF